MAVLSAPCQGNELQKQTAAHQREMALDMLSEIANVFDFPDLNRFLSVSWSVLFTFDFCVCVLVDFDFSPQFSVNVADLNFFSLVAVVCCNIEYFGIAATGSSNTEERFYQEVTVMATMLIQV